ncbi:hypothetical protein CDAR_439181 [Caerostris darwini]|uniref:Uncharacterized protein n=1 Tax=Caerostris darwini TaxID=1538125 RepID=A0AAV4MJA3_9ARAC|nr:hypothetical protein CDAR_439181 [Caerostris darwini]
MKPFEICHSNTKGKDPSTWIHLASLQNLSRYVLAGVCVVKCLLLRHAVKHVLHSSFSRNRWIRAKPYAVGKSGRRYPKHFFGNPKHKHCLPKETSTRLCKVNAFAKVSFRLLPRDVLRS